MIVESDHSIPPGTNVMKKPYMYTISEPHSFLCVKYPMPMDVVYKQFLFVWVKFCVLSACLAVLAI